MSCEILEQITMFQTSSSKPSAPVTDDVVHRNGEIFTSPMNYYIGEAPDWFPTMAWGKRLKDGAYVFHAFKTNDRPKNPRKDHSATLQDRKRRFLYQRMMDSGNPTWKDVSDFENWVNAYENATTAKDVKELVCNRFCFICKKRKKKNYDTDDIGEDAVLLSVNGFKNDRRKAN